MLACGVSPQAPEPEPSLEVSTLAPRQWTWIPVRGTQCRDGSSTGMAVSTSPGSTKLLIFLEGGGACFNPETCALPPRQFGAAEFALLSAVGGTSGGILSRELASNPARDWNMVFIPYCTGDVHAGAQPNGVVPGVLAPQAFVGHTNVTLDLRRIAPAFPGTTEIVLTGISAGGFGAAANYEQVAGAFRGVPVTLLDDAGPYMANPYLATCLQQQWKSLWNVDAGALSTCGADCTSADWLADFWQHLARVYPSRVRALISADNDSTISRFFGFGEANCTSYAQLDAATFRAGLDDVRARQSADANFASFYFPGTQHTTLASDTLFETVSTTSGARLSDWVNAVFAGQVSNVGP